MVENRGRPRSFDKQEALEQVLELFWQRGFLGTSYTDLCAETGLSKPSLYAAFGNKDETFLAALDLYLLRYVQPGIEILKGAHDAREAIREMLVETVKGLTDGGTPPGCMIATNVACMAAPDLSQSAVEAIKAAAKKTPNSIAKCLAKAQDAGQIPSNTTVEALTGFFSTFINGLSGLAKQGTSSSELLLAVDTAMLVWPSDVSD